ncbi:MAG: acyl-CoA dehydrogenase family protein, partial [Pseudomonadota bacterium]
MDFNDTPEEAEFRAEAHAFLEKNLDPKGAKPLRQRVSGEEFMARAKEWQAKKAEAGYAQITWPKEIGGRGGTPMQQVIWNQEE